MRAAFWVLSQYDAQQLASRAPGGAATERQRGKRMTRHRLGAAAAAVVVALAGSACAAGPEAPRDTAAAPAAQQKRALIVQSTTSVRDSGVLEKLIAPQFKRRFPQYDLKFIAVGTGQAIANARAGQADVLIGHSPALERRFLRDGFSFEPVGRTVMWNDFVILGPASDRAGILRPARHDGVSAFEAIARAGAAGRANFVSRGDDSGTNTKEKDIWALSRVAHTPANEPAGDPRWYHKAGVGMADTLRLTQQCPFPGGGCYTITDRGTLQQLTSNRAITALRLEMDAQSARARGGQNLMLNVYNVYAVNPRKFPAVNLKGALAFMDLLTSPSFQASLARFPSARRPGFFPAALPRVRVVHGPARRVSARRAVTVSGRLASAVPGARALTGVPLRLGGRPGARSRVVARGRASARGAFRLRARLTAGGTLVLATPRFRNLSPLSRPLGRVAVRGARAGSTS